MSRLTEVANKEMLNLYTVTERGNLWRAEISLSNDRYKRIKKIGVGEYCQSKSSNVIQYTRSLENYFVVVGHITHSDRIETAYVSASHINSIRYMGYFNCIGLSARSEE